jgi:hypothetical protein
MAIESMYLSLLLTAIEKRREKAGAGRLSALAFSYPDLLVPKGRLEKLFGAEMVSRLPQREDAAEILRWHGLTGAGEPIYDTKAVFDHLELDVTFIDIVAARGDERIVDLNEPLPADLRDRFDFVIDTGTCEHCFNVGMAFRNACEAVGPGGFLVHTAPLNRYNHGFWSFNPTIYVDYFEDNGFFLHFLSGVECTLATGFKLFPVEPLRRFNQTTANAALLVMAERTEVRPQVWPMQRKYRG